MKNVPYSIAMAGLRILVARNDKTSLNPLERLDESARGALGMMLAMGVSSEAPSASFHVKVATLGKALGKAKASVDRAISALVKAGLIERHQERKVERPSVANTRLTEKAVELLFGSASASDSMPSSTSDSIHTTTSDSRHVNSKTLKGLENITVNPPRERVHARTHTLMCARELEGGGGFVFVDQQSEAANGHAEIGADAPPRAERVEFKIPIGLLYLKTEFGLNESQISVILKLCKQAGINFQLDYWPVMADAFIKANDKMSFAIATITPEIKNKLEMMKQKAVEAKAVEAKEAKIADCKKSISKYIGKTFEHTQKNDFKIEVSSQDIIEQVFSNGDRKRIAIDKFFDALEKGHLAEFKKANFGNNINDLEGQQFEHVTEGYSVTIENGCATVKTGHKAGQVLASAQFLAQLKRTIFKPSKIEASE